jgi:type IV pilus assembly protein PilM
MASPRKILVLDLGMQSLRIAEFSVSASGSLTLIRGAAREFLLDPALDSTRPDLAHQSIKEILREWKLKSAEAVCVLPAQAVFTRVVALDVPGGISGKVHAVAGFEAQQNIPFPLEEVVWDHVVMGETPSGAVNVVFLAIKRDLLESLCESVLSAGLRISSVTVAPLSLYDSFRYTGLPAASEPTLILDIGSRTSNMLVAAEGCFFTRSIPAGGLAVTSAIAKEIQITTEEAEQLKLSRGSVGLGPGFEPPSDPVEANLSRVARQALLKIQADISRSLSYHRSNLGGEAPSRILLTGGMASMPYLAEFIHEKLGKETGFFNPLERVTVAPQAADFVASHPNNFGELVGGALQILPNGGTATSLLPPSIARKRDFAARLPYLVTAVMIFLATLVAWLFFALHATDITRGETQQVIRETDQKSQLATQIITLQKQMEDVRKTGQELSSAVLMREAYPKILSELADRIPSRFLWITEIQPATEPSSKGVSGKNQDTSVKALIVKGLYLDNPRQASVIDDFVTSLQSSDLFAVEEKEKSKIITERSSPNEEFWAYPFSLRIPLKSPIQSLP